MLETYLFQNQTFHIYIQYAWVEQEIMSCDCYDVCVKVWYKH